MEVSVIIPTYNEAENVQDLIREVMASLADAGMDGEVVVVDDGSPDGTADLAEAMAPLLPVRVVRRQGKMGLGSAVVAGFGAAQGTIMVVMDADFSHPPSLLPGLVRALEGDRADVAIGSRHVAGGGTEGWGRGRRLVSWGATLLARPLTPVKDPMSGLFALRKDVVEGVALSTRGYKILLEILVKGNIRPGLGRVVEVPFVFKDRRAGNSKLGVGEFSSYAGHVLRLMSVSRAPAAQFLRFATIGAIGVLVNLAVLFALVEWAGLWYVEAAMAAFMMAVTVNYVGNRLWTFRDGRGQGVLRTAEGLKDVSVRYCQFFAISVMGLFINLAVLYMFVEMGEMWYFSGQMLGILVATAVNFAGNRYWTFKARVPAPAQATAPAPVAPSWG